MHLLNMLPRPVMTNLSFVGGRQGGGAERYNSQVRVEWLQSDDTAAVNTAGYPNFISPKHTSEDLSKPLQVPGYSFAVFETQVQGTRPA